MYVALAARICLALVFLNAGIKHVTGFSGFVETIASQGLPLPGLLGIGAIVALLVGSVCLLLGYQTKVGAGLLIIFLVPTTLLFHPATTDLGGFLKNLALIGGLLMTIDNGPGLMSVDGDKR
ncbi:MAG: DoxX family protein [Cyanobacteria bacterium J06598_1]